MNRAPPLNTAAGLFEVVLNTSFDSSSHHAAHGIPAWMLRPVRLVPALIAMNIAVFLGWQVIPNFFYEHFLISSQHLQMGRFWTLITSAFSHNMLLHLVFNMMVLYSFGSFLERFLGKRRFIIFYLSAAVCSSLNHCLTTTYFLKTDNPALGASGALAGMLLLFALIFPKHKILLFGIIPIPALVAAIALIGFDVFGLIAQEKGQWMPIGHGAHLGGSIFGGFYYLLYLRKHIRRRRPEY